MMSVREFSVASVQVRGVAHLVVLGEVDLQTEPRLVDAVAKIAADVSPAPLVLNLEAVTFIDSAGLRGLLRAQQAAEDAGCAFALGRASEPVETLLAVAGVEEWFERA